MGVSNPVKVPQAKVDSLDIVGFQDGLNLNGAQNATLHSFISSKDMELTVGGLMAPRRVLRPFLPDTVEITYQKLPVFWNGELYFFTADDDKIVYCQQGDAGWTDCTGDNTITTNNGGKPKFIRVLDNVLCLNGTNGDRLCYVELSTFDVVKYTHVDDPTTALTGALTGLTSGSFNVYYSYNYNGAVGDTLIAPILTKSINVVRDQWTTLGTPGSIKVSRPAGSPPAGAEYWTLFIAIAATGGTIQDSDMLQIAVKLDLNTLDFVDDGTLDINLGAVAPVENSTEGPYVDQGIVEDGNPILFADPTHPEAIYIGGGGPYAMSFSVSNGGYTAEPEKGTNYTPSVIIGFRNGQGIPSLTVLYSNTEGLSKQSVLEQQQVNYGDQSFFVWGVTEQHYGAAGVTAPNSPINYNGKLLFFSDDGIMSMNTEAARQNVIATVNLSTEKIDPYIRSIQNIAMGNIVGTGWNNKFMFTVPNDGFTDPQQILVSDDNNGGAYYTLDIPAQWIGVVSPQTEAAFVYVSRGNKTYKLIEGDSTYDVIDGVPVPFSTKATGPLAPMSGGAHNTWMADVQAVFNVLGLIGDITVGVTYRNQNGKLKTKKKLYHGPRFTPSGAGGWGDPGWVFANFGAPAGWGASPVITSDVGAVESEDVRIPVRIDEIHNEAQWWYTTDANYNYYNVKSISFEGINLGVRPDLQ